MSIKEAKIEIETTFQDGWTSTPIHYSGMEFDSTGRDRWINLIYQPISVSNRTLTAGRQAQNAVIYVLCWANNELNAYDLADNVADFVLGDPFANYAANRYVVEDQGYSQDGRSFVILSFDVKQKSCNTTN